MVTVYLDVLIVLNIYVNFFLVKATAKLLHRRITVVRCIISSVFGSLFSLVILLPPMSMVASTSVKLAAAFLVVLSAFGFSGLAEYLKNTFVFFSVNFIFCGVVYGFILLTNTDFIASNNSCFYIDFSLLTLIVSTSAAYFVIGIIRRIFDKRSMLSDKFSVIVSFSGNTFSLSGVADTGNTLTDAFTGLPVIVCDYVKLGLPWESTQPILNESSPHGVHFLPYTSVNKSGIIPVFTPMNVLIRNETSRSVKPVEVMIGIAERQQKDCEAIFNPNILV